MGKTIKRKKESELNPNFMKTLFTSKTNSRV